MSKKVTLDDLFVTLKECRGKKSFMYMTECMMESRQCGCFDFLDDFNFSETALNHDSVVNLLFSNGSYRSGYVTPKNEKAKKELAYVLFFIAYQRLSSKKNIRQVYNFYLNNAERYKESILKDAEEKIGILFDNPYFDSDGVTVQRFANAIIISQMYLQGDVKFLQTLSSADDGDDEFFGKMWMQTMDYIYYSIVYEDEIASDFLYFISFIAHNHEIVGTDSEGKSYQDIPDPFDQIDLNELSQQFFNSMVYKFFYRNIIPGAFTPGQISVTDLDESAKYWVYQKEKNKKPINLQSPKFVDYLYATGRFSMMKYLVQDIIIGILPKYLSVSKIKVPVMDDDIKTQLKSKDEEIERLKAQLQKKQTVINRLDKENEKLKNEHKNEESEKLDTLQKTNTEMDEEKPVLMDDSPDIDEIVERIKDKRYVMIGGFDNGQSMAQYLPNIRFVEASNRNAPKFDMKGYDMLLIRANCTKHSTTNRYVNMARSTKTPILYIGENAQMSVRQIYEAFYKAS